MVKKESKKAKSNESVPVSFPSNNNFLFYLTGSLVFLTAFVCYILTLAPTVTLEDSGELVAAAYYLGVPHEPGYPLFTLFGKLFTFLPIGNIAFRVNIASAFFTSMSAMLLYYTIVYFIELATSAMHFWNNLSILSGRILKYSAAATGALLFALAFETWEQSIIAEVYGVNNFFFALFLFVFAIWLGKKSAAEKNKYFLLLSFVAGMALTTHTTAAMLVPVLGLFMILFERKMLFSPKLIIRGLIFFVIGLSPFLYLYFASIDNPPVDWGNPETLKNLFRVITRHQYQFEQDVPVPASEVFSFFFTDLLPEQWFFVFIILAPVGLYLLYSKCRQLFWFAVFFLFFTIPVMSYLTRDYLTNSENRTLVSIAYIPAYMILSVLISLGLVYILSLIRKENLMLATFVLLPVVATSTSVYKNYSRTDMSKYLFAQVYADNIFNNMPKNSLLFINWDPFGFPLTYYQFVEKKRPDIIVIDQMLLKRSWYIDWLRNYYPELMKNIHSQTEGFLHAVAPFENSEAYDGSVIQRNYIGMINAFIDFTRNSGNQVYFTYYPEKDILRKSHLEPKYFAYEYTDRPTIDTLVSDRKVDVFQFADSSLFHDRMAYYMSDYYADLYGSRAFLLEQLGKPSEALSHYKKALSLCIHNKQKKIYTEKRIALITNNLNKIK